MLFAARAWLVFAVLFPFAFAAAALANVATTWRIGRWVARSFLRLAGIPVIVRGQENLPAHEPAVLASNHTSYLDAVVLLARLDYRGYAFVAKQEFLGHFVMRTLLKGFGTRFVERFDVRASAEDAGTLVDAARGGVSLIVFPEGTLRRTTGLMPFRTGAFRAAAQAGVPIVPIALRGVRSVLRDGTWWPRRAPIAMTICPPVRPAGSDWSAAVSLRERVRTEILKHCGEPDLAAPGGSGGDGPEAE